jgi:hypothetical protein
MFLAALFHIVRGECNLLPTHLVLGGVAALMAYGRLFVRPIAPASLSNFRVLKGLAVLGALVLVDFAPVWYKLTHLVQVDTQGVTLWLNQRVQQTSQSKASHVGFFAGFTSSLAFRSSAIFIVRLSKFQITPSRLDLSSFL